jgi:hypothetical protein
MIWYMSTIRYFVLLFLSWHAWVVNREIHAWFTVNAFIDRMIWLINKRNKSSFESVIKSIMMRKAFHSRRHYKAIFVRNPIIYSRISFITSGTTYIWIIVREYRRENRKWIIQRNWQHRVHKTKTNKTKTQYVLETTTRRQTQITYLRFQPIQTSGLKRLCTHLYPIWFVLHNQSDWFSSGAKKYVRSIYIARSILGGYNFLSREVANTWCKLL